MTNLFYEIEKSSDAYVEVEQLCGRVDLTNTYQITQLETPKFIWKNPQEEKKPPGIKHLSSLTRKENPSTNSITFSCANLTCPSSTSYTSELLRILIHRRCPLVPCMPGSPSIVFFYFGTRFHCKHHAICTYSILYLKKI